MEVLVQSYAKPNMQLDSPVFIMGLARSGTSIMYRALQMHTSFKPSNLQRYPYVELKESKVFRNPYSICVGHDSNAYAYMLGNDELYRKFTNENGVNVSLHKLLQFRNVPYKLISESLWFAPDIRAKIWHLFGKDLLLRSYFRYAVEARGAKRILEKTPKHILHLPEIRQTYPDCKIIFCARHPVDVYSSYRKRLIGSIDAGIDRKRLGWLELSPKTFCRKYLRHTSIAIQEAESHYNSMMIIRYEDFTKNYNSTIKGILHYLEEPDEVLSLDNEEGNSVAGGNRRTVLSAVNPRTKNWKDYMSAEEGELIEDRLSESMRYFHYKKYSAVNS